MISARGYYIKRQIKLLTAAKRIDPLPISTKLTSTQGELRVFKVR
jgi:hypothetical protein